MITQDRLYRSFKFTQNDEKVIEGYAATFDSQTVLYEIDGIEYKEVIAKGAFDGADLKDVVLVVDHEGKPIARTKNNSLQLTVDNVGLKIRADLSNTQYAREVYEEIRQGLFDKMSFAFTVADESYDRETRTRTIKSIKRLYDVSVVTFPAYESTSVSARSFFELEREKELAEAKEIERRKLKLKLLIETEI